MGRTKSLLFSLAVVSVLCSFAVTPGTTQSASQLKRGLSKTTAAPLCSQWLQFCNNGSVSVFHAIITKYPVDLTITNLTSGNCDGAGPSLWGWGTEAVFDFKVSLDAPQNGSIKVYESGVLVYCEPTDMSTSVYRFQVDITGCHPYTVEVTTVPC